GCVQRAWRRVPPFLEKNAGTDEADSSCPAPVWRHGPCSTPRPAPSPRASPGSTGSSTSRYCSPSPSASCSGTTRPSLGESMKPLGDGFIKLVKMIIAPVIFLTVTTGIAAMSDLKKVGRVTGKAMLYFFTFSTLALVIGMIVSHVVQPGAGMHIDPA